MNPKIFSYMKCENFETSCLQNKIEKKSCHIHTNGNKISYLKTENVWILYERENKETSGEINEFKINGHIFSKASTLFLQAWEFWDVGIH